MSDKKRKVPKLRFPGFTDSWEQRKLGAIFQKNEEKNQLGIGSEKTISIASMSYKEEGNGANVDSLRGYKILRIGDIAFEGHTNKSFRFGRFILNDLGTGIMSPRFTSLRPTQKINIHFWKHYIHYEPVMRDILVRSTKAGTMMNELVISEFEKSEIAVPNSHEQVAIGKLFNHYDTLLSLHQRKLDNVKMLKKSLLQKLFPKDGEKTPELRFPGFTDAWEQRKLGEIAKIIGGGTPSTSNPEYWDGGIDWYSPAEIGSQIYVSKSVRQISDLGLQKSSAKLLPEGSVLFTSRAGIGNTAILAKESCTNQGFQSIVPNKGMLDTYFIFSQSHALKKYGETVGAGSTFVEVSGKQMERMDISLPIIQEQEKIGAYFKQMDSLLSLHQRKLDHLKELKKGLLQQMFV